jgi:peptide/nickel transport system substrate-binding protein
MLLKLRYIPSVALAAAMLHAIPALAQKQGGTLRLYHWDSPPSASIHEEATISAVVPFMALFNNLVLYDQHQELNTAESIRPELATSWTWNATKTELTFKLRDDVRWHDGKPFTADDVICTMDKLQEKGADQFRRNPRKLWWNNLKQVTANGKHEVVFHLTRPQPSFLSFFATGYSPIYPCHVTAADMRTKPVGTGPFKFVEYKSNESIKLVRNPDLRKGHPRRRYRFAHHLQSLDRAPPLWPANLDMSFVLDLGVAMMRDVRRRSLSNLRAADEQRDCQPSPTDRPPFNDPNIRKALALHWTAASSTS